MIVIVIVVMIAMIVVTPSASVFFIVVMSLVIRMEIAVIARAVDVIVCIVIQFPSLVFVGIIMWNPSMLKK